MKTTYLFFAILFFAFITNTAYGAEQKSLYTSSQTVINGKNIYIGSNYQISKINFSIDGEKQEKNCKNDYFCEITIKVKDSGNKILASNRTDFETKNITVLSSKNKMPQIKAKKITLNKENKLSGKNLTKIVNVHTPFGVFEVKTNKKNFKLKIPTTLTSLPETLRKAPLFVENSNGLVSDIIIVNYEI